MQVPCGCWLLGTGFLLGRSQGVPCCLLLVQPEGIAGGCWASPVLWRAVFWIMFTECIFHFPGENLQSYDQVSSRVTQAWWCCTWKQFWHLCHTDSCCPAQCRCLPNDHYWGIQSYTSPRRWLEPWESDDPHFFIHTLLLLTSIFPDIGKEHWPDLGPLDGTFPRSGLLETVTDKIL